MGAERWKGCFWEQARKRSSDVEGVCLCASRLWGKVLCMQTKADSACHILRLGKAVLLQQPLNNTCVSGCWGAPNKITRCARQRACELWCIHEVTAGGHCSLTRNQYAAALSGHVNLACCCVSRGRPPWHFYRLERQCWAARGPPTRKRTNTLDQVDHLYSWKTSGLPVNDWSRNKYKILPQIAAKKHMQTH